MNQGENRVERNNVVTIVPIAVGLELMMRGFPAYISLSAGVGLRIVTDAIWRGTSEPGRMKLVHIANGVLLASATSLLHGSTSTAVIMGITGAAASAFFSAGNPAATGESQNTPAPGVDHG